MECQQPWSVALCTRLGLVALGPTPQRCVQEWRAPAMASVWEECGAYRRPLRRGALPRTWLSTTHLPMAGQQDVTMVAILIQVTTPEHLQGRGVCEPDATQDMAAYSMSLPKKQHF